MADALDLTTSVDGTSSGGAANWFIEGTAEFIHGADYRVVADLGGVIGLDANQSGGNDIAFNDGAAQTAKVTSNGASIINAIGSGTEGWSASPQYSAGYIATRYLHDELKNNGGGAAPDGIKTMLVWMEANNESVGGALKHFLAGHDAGNYGAGVSNKQAHDNFIAEFKGGAGLTFLQNMDLTNTDTGAITGADADGGATITATEAVPNTGAGFAPDSTAQTQPLATTQGGANGFTLTWEEDSGSLEVTRDGSGETYEMKSVFNSKISDTETYNLKSITSAKATLSELEDLLTKLSSNRATVGANVTRLQNELQGLAGKITQGEMAVSRIEDADIAQESSNYASTQVRTQASIAILAQAKQLNVGVSDLLRGVNIGG
jgi:flagellin